MNRGPLLPLLFPLLLSLSACQPDMGPPTGSSGECNNDKVCDTSKESCLSCPGDCSCCHGYVVGHNTLVKNPEAALGKPDGKFAELSAGAVLVVHMASPVTDRKGDNLKKYNEFSLTGQVSEPGTDPQGVHVFIKDPPPKGDNEWDRLVATWMPGGPSKTPMDVTQPKFSSSTFTEIKLEVTPNATAKLDAIEALACQ